MINRAPDDIRGLGVDGMKFMERYVSAINVKCLLFLLSFTAPILANRIGYQECAKRLRTVGLDTPVVVEKKHQQYRFCEQIVFV